MHILKPELSEEKTLELINRYHKLLLESGAKNIFIQNRGRRHLVYSIQHSHDGIFLQINYDGNGPLTNLFRKNIKFDDNIIRSLILKTKQH
uniref:ribosomal protein S6 n=1 Tax=Glaucosphaera vacuolata TaxID=38265 RepID=UPI001FCD6BA4|nr:ribosomal protein S6 [Glaucosphaera vacuolata]UNJ18672.1 ribosomal protein S6 [Glaucosphaera vacuolata]